MKIIGLAGRPGAGKSAVARVLAADPGIVWIDLDVVAWETYAPGGESYAAVVARFGEEILASDGSIDRGELAVRVFLEPRAREDLEGIVHPAVLARLEARCAEEEVRGADVVLIEGALLSTSPHVDRSLFDAMIWLDADDAVREKRLQTEGRADHVARADDVVPGASDLRVDAEGAIDVVVDRVREVIDGL
jgi:dephospho-CoA kinase